MNDRIKELLTPKLKEWGANSDDNFSEEIQKFAEMIVLEMCNVLDRAQWDKGEDWVCADGTRIIPTVKLHFGVEE